MGPPARPRILLADDHRAFLESVGRFLAHAYDIVALADDGRQALDLAGRLRPDVAVLDVSMPELDGFQVLEQLRRDAPHTRVVFLTMHRDDEFVAKAINAGAHGYVLKSRIHFDLIGAIDHALAGRLFVPSLTSLSTVAEHRHTVQFRRPLPGDVSRLVSATLLSGEPFAFVASEATRTGVAQRLRARQVNLARLAERGQYVEHDSAFAVSQIMRDGRPDKERVAEMIHDLEQWRLAAPDGPGARLTIFGDISPSLWRNGDFEAALEMERLWSELTRPLPFFTICSYPSECFEQSAARDHLPRLCAEHSAVTS
jgi:DNA-binding NarL/FixJ family response regulator